MTETQVNDAQAGAAVNPAPDGSVNGSQEVADLKDILGPVFGTQFKTDEDALKSVEHAKNMAGKVGQLEQTINQLKQQTMNPELETKVQQLEQTVKHQVFFTENPQYNTPEAKKLISAMGQDPAQVVESEVFKLAFDAIKVRNEMEQSKSVLHSNPKLGIVQDKFTQAQEALKSGNDAAASSAAVAAVLETFEAQS